MKKESARQWLATGLLALALLAPGWAVAEPVTFDRIVVFGTSLSDPGNAFTLIKQQNTPPYNNPDLLDPFLVPSAPYAIGVHHFSNGATWIEQFAESAGFAGNVRPAFQAANNQATNYAVGGARARNDEGRVDLPEQVGQFLIDSGGKVPDGALYVIEVGANDVRDALKKFSEGQDGSIVIADALTAIYSNIVLLHGKGAKKFLVANVPDLGLTPAIQQQSPGAQQLARTLSAGFNSGLNDLLSGLQATTAFADSQFVQLDVFGKLNEVVRNPAGLGFDDAAASCITLSQPYTCETPDKFFFWDGIHPTKAGHAIFAQEAARVLGLGADVGKSIRQVAERVLAQPLQDAGQPWWVSNATTP